MTTALRLEDVVVVAGETRLLDGVSLDVERGKIVAVVGPNGAGKTTLLDAISGVVVVVGGAVHVGASPNGHRIGTPRPGVGRVFQGSPLPETLTVGEVATLSAGSRANARVLLDRFGLGPHATRFVAELSTGMRRILDLALATVGSPQVLLLDEPASGLAQSEVEHLAELIVRWRDATGAAVIVVEHDAWLVRKIADEIVAMEGGRIAARGTARHVLAAARKSKHARVASPQEEHFRDALGRITANAKPAPPLVKRTLSKWTLMRLGLREFSAGLSAVLILGVLNRVMKVELGISLGVVATILSSYNLAAPLALTVGHRSDTHPIMGRRRTPYIIGGAAVTGLCVAGAPHLARALSGGISPLVVVGGLALFVAMGIGMYGSGTVFFALIADIAPPKERGHAASVVYLELLAGILFGVALTGVVLKDNASNLGTLFALAGVLVLLLTTVAVWGQEKHAAPREETPPGERTKFLDAVRSIAAIPQARTFFVFMVLATLFLFLQQAVLEPFGGEVLGLGVRATSTFNAVMSLGTVIGMVVAGRPFAEQYGHRRIAVVGLSLGALTFGGLALAAASSAAPPAWFAIFGIGLATGAFNVATLALMMGMADRARTALFMGTWTVAHAIADGIATAGGGIVYETLHKLTDSVPGGYAGVFAIEAVGLALCMPLLRKIDPDKFAESVDRMPPEEMELFAADPFAASLGVPEPVTEPSPLATNGAPRVTTRAARASKSSPPRSSATTPRTRSGAGP